MDGAAPWPPRRRKLTRHSSVRGRALLKRSSICLSRNSSIRGARVDFVLCMAASRLKDLLSLRVKFGVDAALRRARRRARLQIPVLDRCPAGSWLSMTTRQPICEALSGASVSVLPEELHRRDPRGSSAYSDRSCCVSTAKSSPSDKPLVFAAMPFRREFDEFLTSPIAGAAYSLNLTSQSSRVDHDDYVGDVVEHIKRLHQSAKYVVADLSESRPNVLFGLRVR